MENYKDKQIMRVNPRPDYMYKEMKITQGLPKNPSPFNGKNGAQRRSMRTGFACLKGPIKKLEFYPQKNTERKRARLVERIKRLFAKGAFGKKSA